MKHARPSKKINVLSNQGVLVGIDGSLREMDGYLSRYMDMLLELLID
jgi:hypothetical protein